VAVVPRKVTLPRQRGLRDLNRRFITRRLVMYFVYILQSEKDGRLYIGFTDDIKRRPREHNEGKSLATRPFRPYKLIYYEAFLERKDAEARENILKSGWGRRSIKKMLKFYFGVQS